MSVNYELYKIFACVVKNGSITNTAKELYISQPAVSQSIKQLESQLGGKLFRRTPKGMVLTAEGNAIYEYIYRANGLIEQAETRFEQMRNLAYGSIKIGASDNICRNFLMKYVEQYSEQYPQVKIIFVNGTSSQTVQLLKTGKVDIGFVNLPVGDDEIKSQVVGELHDCFVAGSKYEHLKGKQITVKELLSNPMILLSDGTTSRKFINEYFGSQGSICQPTIEVGSHDLLISFAKRNMGISCVTEEFIKGEISRGELFKLDIYGDIRSRQIGLIQLNNVTQTFASEKFVELLQNRIKSFENKI